MSDKANLVSEKISNDGVEQKSWLHLKSAANWTTLTVGLLIVLIGWFIFVRPQQERANELSDFNANQLETEIERKQVELVRIKQLSKALDELPAQVKKRLQEALPSSPNEPDLLVNMEALGQASGLDLKTFDVALEQNSTATSKDIDPETKAKLAGLRPVGIRVTYDGISYTVLKSFLQNLEKNLRFMRLDSFAFAPSKAEISFELTSYYFE